MENHFNRQTDVPLFENATRVPSTTCCTRGYSVLFYLFSYYCSKVLQYAYHLVLCGRLGCSCNGLLEHWGLGITSVDRRPPSGNGGVHYYIIQTVHTGTAGSDYPRTVHTVCSKIVGLFQNLSLCPMPHPVETSHKNQAKALFHRFVPHS
jgi:hypothetical protein